MKKNSVVFLSILFSSYAISHGLMVDPPSRNAICGLNEQPHNASSKACIDAFANDAQGGYSFMSVLTHTQGRSKASTLPDNVCSFDSSTWQGSSTPWDKPTDWPATPVQPGGLDITWDIQWGPHFDDTEEFHYWITKPEFVFDPTQPLKWTDFEDTPFCSLYYDDGNPNANPNIRPNKSAATFTTRCNIPPRNGHHVIYGEWGRNQWTYERFHGCLDVNYAIGNSIPPTAYNMELSLDQNTNIAFTLNATDSDGQIVDYGIIQPPAHGTLAGDVSQIRYTPKEDFFGRDEFYYNVVDNDNLISNQAKVTILVNKPGNTPPVARFSYQVSGLEVLFDASSSFDADGDSLSYFWDFGDNSTSNNIGAVHTYAESGHYYVTLTVDDGSITHARSETISVSQPIQDKATCEYVIVNEWQNGFIAEVRIINATDSDIEGWSVHWEYSNDTTITNHWNSNLHEHGHFMATPLEWNRNIRANQQVTFGFQGSFTGVNEIPTINGDVCR